MADPLFNFGQILTVSVRGETIHVRVKDRKRDYKTGEYKYLLGSTNEPWAEGCWMKETRLKELVA